jgi:hypothetical protein
MPPTLWPIHGKYLINHVRIATKKNKGNNSNQQPAYQTKRNRPPKTIEQPPKNKPPHYKKKINCPKDLNLLRLSRTKKEKITFSALI